MATPTPPPAGADVAGSAVFKKFLSAAEGYLRQPTRPKQLLIDAYHKASEKNELGHLAHEAWTTLQSLFRLIRASVSGEYTGVPGTTIAAAVAVLVYFMSPIDLIPDFIPVLGLLDDVALIAWFSSTVKDELDKFHQWETTRPALADGSTSASLATDRDMAESSLRMNHETINQSAKNHGTTDRPSAPAGTGQSATDAGLGSPSSSTQEPVHSTGPDAPGPQSAEGDDVSRGGDSSRDGDRSARNDAGGNVR